MSKRVKNVESKEIYWKCCYSLKKLFDTTMNNNVENGHMDTDTDTDRDMHVDVDMGRSRCFLTFFPFNLFCHEWACFFPFDVLSRWAFFPFSVFSIRRFLLFNLLSQSMFFPFDVLSHSAFFPFDVLSYSAYCLSTFCRSTYCTFIICYFNILSVHPLNYSLVQRLCINRSWTPAVLCLGWLKYVLIHLKRDNANKRIPVSHKYPPGDLNPGPFWWEAKA
jgi:hypothetical protein